MMEREYLLKGLELYKSLIDKLAIPESDEPIPLDEVERKVQYLADQKHLKSPLTAWASMNESQKEGMALLLKYFGYVNYHNGISTTLRELSEAEIKIDGIELPKEPYDEFMFYDFISRSMGYDWPEELGSELREKLSIPPRP